MGGGERGVNGRSFFSTHQCLCRRFSTGSDEVKPLKECVSSNKHQQIPSNPASLLVRTHARTHTHSHSDLPPPPLQGPNKRLGKKMAALWPPLQPPGPAPPPPLLQHRPGSRRKRGCPALLPWRTSQSARYQSRLRQSQEPANALEGMFQFKIKQGRKKRRESVEKSRTLD